MSEPQQTPPKEETPLNDGLKARLAGDRTSFYCACNPLMKANNLMHSKSQVRKKRPTFTRQVSLPATDGSLKPLSPSLGGVK